MTTRKKNCFIIGPMSDAGKGDQARLKLLARNIIRPLMDDLDLDYKVKTPYDLNDPHIMSGVVTEIDRADLVIADITGANPNVFYELAICHSLGQAYIVVMEEGAPDKEIPFDIRQYVYVPIRIDDVTESKGRLLRYLRNADDDIQQRRLFKNPVTTAFNNIPLSNIAPAGGLALGYYQNLVEPAASNIAAMNEEDLNEHRYNVEFPNMPLSRVDSSSGKLFVADPDGDGKKTVFLSKAREVRRHQKLTIIIPDRLECTRKALVGEVNRELHKAVIRARNRDVNLFAREENENLTFYDIPTTMAAMEAAIERRFGVQADRGSEDWRRIEREEIDRFEYELNWWIQRNDVDVRNRVEVLRFSFDNYDTRLSWLYDIWRAHRTEDWVRR